jgi:hypothetical protein
VPLEGIDEQTAIAHVSNASGIEYLARMSNYPPDDGAQRVNGIHIAPAQIPPFLRLLRVDDAKFGGGAAPEIAQLRALAQEAQKGRKSLIFVKDRVTMPGETRQAYLAEELNHALQARVSNGKLENHLGPSAAGFTGSPLGVKTEESLVKDYQFRDASHAALEIGERLMRGAYEDLGLTREEAHTLGDEYVQLLRREYGSAAEPVIEKVTESQAQPGTERGDEEVRTDASGDARGLRRGPGTGTAGGGPKVESSQNRGVQVSRARSAANRGDAETGTRTPGSALRLRRGPGTGTAGGGPKVESSQNSGVTTPSGTGVYLGAGLGALQPYLDRYISGHVVCSLGFAKYIDGFT